MIASAPTSRRSTLDVAGTDPLRARTISRPIRSGEQAGPGAVNPRASVAGGSRPRIGA